MATCPVNRLMTLDNFAHGAPYPLLREWRQIQALTTLFSV